PLLELPLEIVENIIAYADNAGFLALRKVCRPTKKIADRLTKNINMRNMLILKEEAQYKFAFTFYRGADLL
ncbi:hypothetical protein PFISCL1PPCAC_640, partial [Pristionchus fissidentatus]